jgi:membrane-bound lytic murein transglycosylase B
MAAGYLAHVLSVAVAVFGAPAPPTTSDEYVTALNQVRPRLRAEARAWDGTGAVPDALAADALYEQRLVLALADRKRLRATVLPQLDPAERPTVADEVRAQVALSRLSAGYPARRRYSSGPAEPAADLWSYYETARTRFGVTRELLAAVNFVETDFNRLQNNSHAGAQGPMQFIPATWKAYGMGGDVHDPHDAILGAANYLHANGAPADDSGALYHYNPSLLYVKAVRRYARRMTTPAGFRAFYARSLFVRKPGGGRRRLTGPEVE